MTTETSTYTSMDAITQALNFPGVVVESKLRIWEDGNTSWEQTIWSFSSNKFQTDRIGVVAPDSQGYPRSNHYERLLAYRKLGAPIGGGYEAIEGVAGTFKTEIKTGKLRNGDGYTSVHYLPTKVENTLTDSRVLDGLKAKLQADRDKAGSAPRTTAATPTYSVEDINTMKEYLSGKTEGDYTDIKALPVHLANGIRNGEAIMFLIGQGHMDRSSDGVLTVVS